MAGLVLFAYLVLMMDNYTFRTNSSTELYRLLMARLTLILLPTALLLGVSAFSVRLKCEFTEEGITISGKRNAVISLSWSDYKVCRPRYRRGTRLMLLAKLPSTKVGKTTVGSPDDGTWNPTKYMLEAKIGKYARGRITEEELRNTEVFLLEVGKIRYQQIEAWWNNAQKDQM